MGWLNKIIQIFKIKDLRNKILFVLFIFVIFRLMAGIPMPGIDASGLEEFFAQNQFLGLLNMFTGGALDRFSIVMLGLGPYITATIILQLLTMIFPQLERMYKEEGERGKAKFNQYGRIATIPLAAMQGFAMIKLFQSQGVLSYLSSEQIITALITITAGTVFLMWLGELISEKGIGNGVSLLIFAGIVADIPNNIGRMLTNWNTRDLPGYIGFFIMSLVIIAVVVLITEGRRNIPVSYAKRIRGQKMYGGVQTYLPLNINPAGVIPIIFAMSIILFPGMIAQFLGGAGGLVGDIAQKVGAAFNDPWIYGIVYFILVIMFTYFYTAVTFDPKTIASNLQKMGGFVPGIRPGEPTAKFMYRILNRVLLVGALFLGGIAVMPSIVQGITDVQVFSFLIGGTALLIMVSVVLDVLRQIRAQLQMREYETF